MIPKTHALVAALAAASWSLTPAAYSQVEEQPPTSATSQDPSEALPPTEQSTERPSAEQQPSAEQEQSAQQETTPAPSTAAPSAAPGTATAPIEDKKIEQFADAYLAVQTIQQKAAAELQNASTPEQADKVKATAETDMIAAVERSGLQVPEFNRIVETMAADVNLRSRVAAELEKRSGGGGT